MVGPPEIWWCKGQVSSKYGGAGDRSIFGYENMVVQVSLSRLNHWLPWAQAHPEVVQGTTEFHHQITDARLPQADPVFDDATALDTAVDMLDP